jgi:hypothetical protein
VTMLAFHDLAPLDRVWRWLVIRLAAYFAIVLLVGQVFIGIAGFGQGGVWITAAVICELFCGLWIITHPGRLHSLWLLAIDRIPSPPSGHEPSSTTQATATDVKRPPMITISAEVEAYLAHLLESSSEAGASAVVRAEDHKVVGVLLSQDEYELLNAAAALARNPDRLDFLMRGGGGEMVSFEEAFGIGAGN